MPRVPDLLLATVAQMAPVAEIDCSVLPAAGTAPFAYEFMLTLEFASGAEDSSPCQVSRAAGADDVADLLAACLTGEGWASWRKGLKVYVARGDGSPVTKVVAEGDGPKPDIRWWPLPRRKK